MRVLRSNRAGRSAESANRARGSRTGTSGACSRIEIWRSLAVVPTIGDLRSARSGAGSFDTSGLGVRNKPAVRTVGSSAATSRDGSTEAARGRHTSSGVGAWEWKNQNRTTVDLRARRSASRRPDTSSGVVRVLTGSQGRTPADTPEQVPRNAAGGCLRRLRADLRNRTHSGSSLLGTRAPEVLRSACRSQISRRGGSAKANRRVLWHREQHPRTNARRTSRDPQCTEPAVARSPEAMAGRDVDQALEEIGHSHCGSLLSRNMGNVAALCLYW